jgi:NAD(P)H-dependent FMN reductase
VPSYEQEGAGVAARSAASPLGAGVAARSATQQESTMSTLLLSTSLDPNSKGNEFARWMTQEFSDILDLEWIEYKDHLLPDFDNDTIFQSESFQFLHEKIRLSSGVIVVSPIYNWTTCANLKKMVEATGCENPANGQRSAWFDKIVTFVSVAGSAVSYMAYSSLAMGLMLDFKCIINPYQVYATSEDFLDDGFSKKIQTRARRALMVKAELIEALKNRKYTSGWEI